MYRCMKYKDQSREARHLKNTVFPDYFLCWDEMESYVDKSPYEKAKGIKPDIAAHPNTGLFPCHLNKNELELDKSLVKDILVRPNLQKDISRQEKCHDLL